MLLLYDGSRRILCFRPGRLPHTAAVYGNDDRAEIRLATCGGASDQSSGHDADNIVAFVHLINAWPYIVTVRSLRPQALSAQVTAEGALQVFQAY